MWKITNKKNKIVLDEFRENIIDAFFWILLELAESIYLKKESLGTLDNEVWKATTYYKNSTNKDLLDIIFSKQREHMTINKLVKDILSKYTYIEIIYNYVIYEYQNALVDSKNYNIAEQKIIDELKTIFKIFFYKHFFVEDNIWIRISKSKFKRSGFHTNFEDENHIEICPYCDIDTTTSANNNEIEHFLPQDKFPFLSMNAYNLVSACGACNGRGEGKGTESYIPIVSPFNIQIGDELKYSVILSKRKLEIKSSKKEIDNYLKLLKLKERYSKEKIFDLVYENSKSIYTSISEYERIFKKKLTNDEIEKCIDLESSKMEGKKQLTFAIKYFVRSFDEYRDMLKK